VRVLVLSSVFPNPRQPNLGVFIRERMRRVASHCEVRVVAPIPWFPFDGPVRGSLWGRVPAVEQQDGLTVYHPRFLSVPGYLKWLDGALYAASLAPFLRSLERSFPFDVIDGHFAYPDGLAAVLLGRRFQRPAVVTLRGSIVRLATYRLHLPQIRFTLRAAARVLAVSESLKRVGVGLGLPASRVRVIPNGVDTARFRPIDRGEARRRLGLPADRTVLLSVGGLNEGKGHHRVISALPRVLAHRPDLLYVIVGGDRPADSFRAPIEAMTERHRLHDNVLVAGERSHDEIPLWLAAADLFCLASRSEGRANVLLEALACGVPVVTTDVGGNGEILTRPALGILVPPQDDDALGRAIVDALDRSWDREALVAHARTHSWETTGRDVFDELRHVVAERPADHAQDIDRARLAGWN